MQQASIGDVENSVQAAAVMRPLTDALEASDLAINYYELEPGDSFAFAFHNHEVQEEVFYVQSGTATFETESGPVEVAAGEAVRFGPGEFQRGWNHGDERVIAIALGAPLEYGTQIKLRYCDECGHETDNRLERVEDDDVVVAYCRECDTETGRWYRGSMPGEVP